MTKLQGTYGRISSRIRGPLESYIHRGGLESRKESGLKDVRQRAQQVKTVFNSFLDGNVCASERKTEEGSSKRGIARAISQVMMQALCLEDSRVRIERQENLEEAKNDPSEVLKAVRELSKK